VTIPTADKQRLADVLDSYYAQCEDFIPLAHLARRLDMNERYLQYVGQALARAGYPLETSCARTAPGWRRARSLETWNASLGKLEHRAKEILLTVSRGRRAAGLVESGRLFDLEEAESWELEELPS
jgi:hypothetical protein